MARALKLYLVLSGILVALAGFTFTLQGLGMVGPPSSFMFQSGAWVDYGLAVFVVGVLLMVVGVLKGRGKKAASGA
jgi:hypothetical protein